MKLSFTRGELDLLRYALATQVVATKPAQGVPAIPIHTAYYNLYCKVSLASDTQSAFSEPEP